MTRPKVASRGEVARGLRPSGGATCLIDPISLCSSRNSNCRFNHFPTPIWTESTATQPRLNHPSCRIQERFRHNHPSFVQSPLQAKFSLIRGRRTSPIATQPLLNHNAAKVPRFIVLSSLSAFQPKRRGRFAAILLENREG